MPTDSVYIPYSEDPEWADVEPVEQYESINPLAPIFYADEYKDATNYFRGIIKKGEMSPRVLDLTERVIRLNPAHYTAWQYRYKTLLALKSPLDLELRLMDELAVKYLKTYQVWHHRRLLITQLNKPDYLQAELKFITRSLNVDEKNYHTWSYRQWLLSYFNDDDLWSSELDLVERLLTKDVRNNSVWHHRFFVVFQSGVRKGDENRDEVVRREISFSKQKISLAPNNASVWNYLRGVLDQNNVPYSTVSTFARLYTVVHPEDSRASDVIDVENPLPSKGAQLPATPAIEFLADVYESEGGEDNTSQAVSLWKSLANEHDTIRKKYWEYRIKEALQAVKT